MWNILLVSYSSNFNYIFMRVYSVNFLRSIKTGYILERIGTLLEH